MAQVGGDAAQGGRTGVVEVGVSYRFRDVQTYSNRTKRGSRTKSYHAWPLASTSTRRRTPASYGRSADHRHPRRSGGRVRSPTLHLGGRWHHPVDAMHFQYDGPPVKHDMGEGAGTPLTQGMEGD